MELESAEVALDLGVEAVKRDLDRWARVKDLIGLQVEKDLCGVCDVEMRYCRVCNS